ncbi:hypothetical protein C8F01DRAFT_1115093 [Mycena amicta]|nr:hypothetical protein C8F01DRAFT_1115093 [Mycena amicta]
MPKGSTTPPGTPFPHLFDSTHPTLPSHHEKTIVQQIIAEKKAHLATLNAKVPRRNSGKKIPRKLRLELETTRYFIKAHQAVIAPWRRLPVELMAEIFVLTLAPMARHEMEDMEVVWDEWMDDREGTLLLGRVCRRWRQIQLSTPNLWSVLSIFIVPGPGTDNVSDQEAEGQLEWVSTWLERSRGTPLHLQIFWDPTSSCKRAVDFVLSIFAGHLHHIAGLCIDGAVTAGAFSLVEANIKTRAAFPPIRAELQAPLLRILGVDLPTGNDWSWVRSVASNAPHLTGLTISDIAVSGWYPMGPSALTSLDLLFSVLIADVLPLIEQIPTLRHLALTLLGPSPTDTKVTTSTSLVRLDLSTDTPETLDAFLSSLRLPALHTMLVRHVYRTPEAWWPQLFPRFFTRSQCALVTLNFLDVEVNEEEIIACLEHKACEGLALLVVVDCEPPADRLLKHLKYVLEEDSVPEPNPDQPVAESGGVFNNKCLRDIRLRNILSTDGLLAELAASRLQIPAQFHARPEPPRDIPTQLMNLRVRFVDGQESHALDSAKLKELQGNFPSFSLGIHAEDEDEDDG